VDSALACTLGVAARAAWAAGGAAADCGVVATEAAGVGWEGVCVAAIGGVEDGGGVVFAR